MKRFTSKKAAAIGITAGLILGAGGAAFAYFTTSGSGSGTGTVGTNAAMVIRQAGIVYSNAATDNALLPGTSAAVNFTVDNPSSGHQQLGTISVASITTDVGHAGCDSATNPTWFTTTTDVVNQDYAPGNNQVVPGTITITLNNANAPQDVCRGAPLTFHYAS